MAEKSYSEKLRDPRWQRRRLEIMHRDEFTCQKCGDKENTLHVHHRWYKSGKEPWEYPGELLVTLCESCHQSEEENKEAQKYLIRAFLVCGNFNTDLTKTADNLIWLQTELGLNYFRQLIDLSNGNQKFNEELIQFIDRFIAENSHPNSESH